MVLSSLPRVVVSGAVWAYLNSGVPFWLFPMQDHNQRNIAHGPNLLYFDIFYKLLTTVAHHSSSSSSSYIAIIVLKYRVFELSYVHFDYSWIPKSNEQGNYTNPRIFTCSYVHVPPTLGVHHRIFLEVLGSMGMTAIESNDRT